jgi:polysaccharide pyruvyl transferase WcaK-like protein
MQAAASWASAVSTRLASFGPRALALGLPRSSGTDTFVLLATSVEGSRGDAAMMEVLLGDLRRRYAGRAVLLCYRTSERYEDLVRQFGVQVTSLEDLARHPWQLRELLGRTHTFRLSGADVVDGFYSPLTSALRLLTVQTFAQAGCDARIISFSFGTAPAPTTVQLWRQLPASVGLLTRDPVSQRRLSSLLGREVAQAADLAFLLEPDATGVDEQLHWIEVQRSRGQTVVGVGVNALLLNVAGRQSLARVLTRLLEQRPQLSLSFVPHDLRPKSSDLDAARETVLHIAARFLDRVDVVAQAHGPRQLKAIAQRLDAVVSGRMHFSIAALSQGVPAFCFRYQGKLEGLLELVGLGPEMDQVSIDSAEFEPQWERVTERIAALLDRRIELSRRISARLEQVKKLSALNLDHPRLPSAAPKDLGASVAI